MKKCPYCTNEIEDTAISCHYCGNNIRDFAKKGIKVYISIMDGVRMGVGIFIVLPLIIIGISIVVMLLVMTIYYGGQQIQHVTQATQEKKEKVVIDKLESKIQEENTESLQANINYYLRVKEAIKQKLKDNYKDYSHEGEVNLVFTLKSDGSIENVKIDNATSIDDKILQDIALKSLKEALPFPPFPKTFTFRKIPFGFKALFKNENISTK